MSEGTTITLRYHSSDAELVKVDLVERGNGTLFVGVYTGFGKTVNGATVRPVRLVVGEALMDKCMLAKGWRKFGG